MKKTFIAILTMVALFALGTSDASAQPKKQTRKQLKQEVENLASQNKKMQTKYDSVQTATQGQITAEKKARDEDRERYNQDKKGEAIRINQEVQKQVGEYISAQAKKTAEEHSKLAVDEPEQKLDVTASISDAPTPTEQASNDVAANTPPATEPATSGAPRRMKDVVASKKSSVPDVYVSSGVEIKWKYLPKATTPKDEVPVITETGKELTMKKTCDGGSEFFDGCGNKVPLTGKIKKVKECRVSNLEWAAKALASRGVTGKQLGKVGTFH